MQYYSIVLVPSVRRTRSADVRHEMCRLCWWLATFSHKTAESAEMYHLEIPPFSNLIFFYGLSINLKILLLSPRVILKIWMSTVFPVENKTKRKNLKIVSVDPIDLAKKKAYPKTFPESAELQILKIWPLLSKIWQFKDWYILIWSIIVKAF